MKLISSTSSNKGSNDTMMAVSRFYDWYHQPFAAAAVDSNKRIEQVHATRQLRKISS